MEKRSAVQNLVNRRGGIKGVFPAAILSYLERRCLNGKTVGDYFDLIAGTSTDGILANNPTMAALVEALSSFSTRRADIRTKCVNIFRHGNFNNPHIQRKARRRVDAGPRSKGCRSVYHRQSCELGIFAGERRARTSHAVRLGAPS